MKSNPMERATYPMERATSLLKLNYEKALNNPIVRKPVAWALYHTWREIDSKEKER